MFVSELRDEFIGGSVVLVTCLIDNRGAADSNPVWEFYFYVQFKCNCIDKLRRNIYLHFSLRCVCLRVFMLF